MLFLIMGRDIEQTIDRSIRDIYGDSQAALLGGDAGLELTRGGRGNPAGMARSQLQRVGWVLEDGQLQRLSWAVLDQAPDSVAIRQKMAGQVQRLNLRFLDQQGQWHLQWPESSREEGEPTFLPRVVEVTVELEDWGAVTRLYRIVSSRPSPAKPGP
jgi:general secretion pathway protein J